MCFGLNILLLMMRVYACPGRETYELEYISTAHSDDTLGIEEDRLRLYSLLQKTSIEYI